MPDNIATKKLNTVASIDKIDGNDSLIIANSNEYVTRVNYNTLAKAIIEEYAGSFLAGKKQSVKDEIDDLSNKTVSTISDMNNAYGLYSSGYWDSNTLNTPYKQGITQGSTGRNGVFISSINQNGTQGVQLALGEGSDDIYIRYLLMRSWRLWDKLPNSADVNNLIKKETIYNITYNPTYSVQGSYYESPSISQVLNEIALKGAGRYIVKIENSSSYSDSFSNLVDSSFYDLVCIVDVISSSIINVTGSISANNSLSVGIIQRSKSNNSWTSWVKMPTRTEVDTLINYTYSLNNAIDIANGDDLIDYYTPGNYRCVNASIAGSLIDCPVSGAFTMKVESVNGMYSPNADNNRVVQIIHDGIDTYKRHMECYNGLWEADDGWIKDPSASEVQNIRAEVDELEHNSFGNNAGGHNSVYRGLNLGTSVTTKQWNAIRNGTFDDLFIGDYWVINGVTWRIAAFNYWLNTGAGSSSLCTIAHVVIIPDNSLCVAKMNLENTTDGAYLGSDFYTGLNNTSRQLAINKINSAFGETNILTHKEFLTNATTNGYASNGKFVDSTVELMSERMVYGNAIFENVTSGTNIPFNYTIDKTQLPLFAFDPSKICNGEDWWLRSIVSSVDFAYVTSSGLAIATTASHEFGIRPVFAIC